MSSAGSPSLEDVDDCGCPPDAGHAHARLFTPPLRELTPETSDGFKFIRFCQIIGFRLLPWQRWLALHVLEKLPDGRPRFRTVVLLIARQNGKSTFASLLILFWLYIQKKHLVMNTAQNLSTAEEVWEKVVNAAQYNPHLATQFVRVNSVNGRKFLLLTDDRRAMPVANVGGAGRGFSPDGLLMDELLLLHDWSAWSSLSKAMNAQPYGQLLGASNAGTAKSVVLSHLRDTALQDIAEGNGTRLGLFEYSHDPELDIGDREGWRQSNPSGGPIEDGYLIGWDVIADAFNTDPPNVFRAEVGCQFVENLDSPLDSVAWREGSDPHGTLEDATRAKRVHVAIEVSADQQQVVLAAAALIDPAAERKRYRVAVLRAWSGPSAIQDAAAEFPEIVKAIRPQSFSWYPRGAGAALAPDVQALGNVVKHEVKGEDVQAVCQQLAEQVKARAVLHPNDALLNAQVYGAERAYIGDGWRFERSLRSSGQVAALYAVGAALRRARLTQPPSFTFVRRS